MTQPDAIDTLLAELRQELSNTPTMLNIALALRRNSAHLLQLVHTMLAELGDEIARAVPVLPEEPAEGDEQDIT